MNCEGSAGIVRPLLPATIRVEERPLVYGPDEIDPEEWRFVSGAVEKRRREFAAGRASARCALRCLGASTAALLPDAQRVPRWPAGVVGSISHTADRCAVAVGWRKSWNGIGIDIEVASPLDPTLEPVVCSAVERAWLDGASDRGRMAKLMFSAKEAAYKCIYPSGRVFLDFADMDIVIELAQGRFVATLLKSAGPDFDLGTVLQGRFAMSERFIATAVALPC